MAGSSLRSSRLIRLRESAFTAPFALSHILRTNHFHTTVRALASAYRSATRS